MHPASVIRKRQAVRADQVPVKGLRNGSSSVAERIGGISWAHFVNDGAANFLPGVLPVILVELNFSAGLAGSIMAALLIGQGLQPFIGLLADRIGGRSLMIAGIVGTAFGAALVALAQSVLVLVIALLIIGVFNAVFHPQMLAATRQIAAKRAAGAMSVVLVGGEIGRGVWPALASAILVAFGRESLVVLAAPGVMTALLLLRWAPKLEPQRKATRIDWRTHAGPLGALVAFCALRALVNFVLITFLPLVWHQHGGNMTTGASLITVLYVVGVVGNLGGGWLGDRIGRRALLVTSMLVLLIATALIPLISGIAFWLAIAIAGVCLFATLPLTVLIGQDFVPEARAFGSGIALGMANAIGALGLLIVSPLADMFSVETPMWIACGAAAIALVLALSMPLPSHLRDNPAS